RQTVQMPRQTVQIQGRRCRCQGRRCRCQGRRCRYQGRRCRYQGRRCRSKADDADTKADGDEVAERSPSPHTFLLEMDEKLKMAGLLGFAEEEVPESVRGAYFYACGRAFRTAAERDLLQLHVNTLARVWRGSSMKVGEMRLALRDALPTAVRDDAFIEALLRHHRLRSMLLTVLQLQEAAVKTVVREKLPERLQPQFAVKRGNKSFMGTCSECRREEVTVWPTNMRTRDSGMYCNACWEVYEKG
ncbi:terminal uridylyltransferase 3, partial [Trypanosoma rangeli]